MADPVRALTSTSYTSLAQYYHGAMAYSYVFFGQVGPAAAIRLRTSMCGVCVLAGEPMFWVDKGGAGGQPSVPYLSLRGAKPGDLNHTDHFVF